MSSRGLTSANHPVLIIIIATETTAERGLPHSVFGCMLALPLGNPLELMLAQPVMTRSVQGQPAWHRLSVMVSFFHRLVLPGISLMLSGMGSCEDFSAPTSWSWARLPRLEVQDSSVRTPAENAGVPRTLSFPSGRTTSSYLMCDVCRVLPTRGAYANFDVPGFYGDFVM